MRWQSTVVKGVLTGIIPARTLTDFPTLIVESEGTQHYIAASDALIEAVDAKGKVGQKVIITAITDADNRYRDTLSMLYEP